MGKGSVRFSRAVVLGVIVAGLMLALSLPSIAFAVNLVPVYRFLNLRTGTHFYTASAAEMASVRDTLGATYRLEGVAYSVDTDNPRNDTPLYRFYNVRNGTHFYTASAAEMVRVRDTLGATYRLEGVAYYVGLSSAGGSTPVYRFYNRRAGAHFYTASVAEMINVRDTMGATFTLEGVAFYLNGTPVVPPTDPTVLPDMPWHVSTTTFCARGAGCHFSSLTVEHYRYPVLSSTKLNCQTCHRSTDANVIAAITTSSDSCIDCHFLTLESPVTEPHPGTSTLHLRNNSCTVAGCHNTNLPITHNGDCRPCHSNGITVSAGTTCTDCHSPASFHGGADLSHQSDTLLTCTGAACHAPLGSDDVSEVHEACANCHTGTGTPTIVNCLNTCHAGIGTSHEAGAAQHQTANTCVTPVCHDVSVVTIHATVAGPNSPNPAPSCAACHEGIFESGVIKPTTNCQDANCHPTDPHLPVTMGSSHTPPSGAGFAGCWLSPACHAFNTDVSLFHIATPTGCAACHSASPTPFGKDCYSCHDVDGIHATANADFAVSQASRHNISGAGGGVKTMFDGSQGTTLEWVSEITSAALQPTWLVEANFPLARRPVGVTAVTTGSVGVVTNNWDFPTVNVFWSSTDASAPVGAIRGLNQNSVVTCFDCHSGSPTWFAGPHGASAQWLIDGNYPGDYSYAELTKWIVTNPAGIKVRSTLDTMTAQPSLTNRNPVSNKLATFYSGGSSVDSGPNSHAIICAKCHDLQNFRSGTSAQTTLPNFQSSGVINIGAVGSSNTAHSSHHQDNADASAQCVNCHIGVPHGWKAPRLLVDTGSPGVSLHSAGALPGDVDPYLDPQHLGTTRTNGGAMLYTTPDEGLTWVAQASASNRGFNRIGMLSLSAVDDHILVDGAARWSEPSCAACNDHMGEDGIRILSPSVEDLVAP